MIYERMTEAERRKYGFMRLTAKDLAKIGRKNPFLEKGKVMIGKNYGKE